MPEVPSLFEQIRQWQHNVSFGTFWSIVAYSVVAISTVFMAFVLREDGHSRMRSGSPNAFAFLIGVVGGWALGVLWVPFNTIDAKIYEQIGATVTAFATGYLLSKLDRVFETLLYEDEDKRRPNRTTLRRAAFFAVGLCATALLVTSSRLDWVDVAARCNPRMFDKESTQLPDEGSCKIAKLPVPKYLPREQQNQLQ